MIKSVVIADDLTGANSTAVLLAQDGFRVGTVLNLEDSKDFEELDVLCLSTNSRALPEKEAYDRVFKNAEFFKDYENIFFNKRLDSRIRGNIGAEIDGILDALGEDYTAVVSTPLPDFNRVCIGDILFVDGVALERTDVTKDAITPVFESSVTKVVKQQSKYPVGHIGIKTVLAGPDAVKEELIEKAKEYRTIVIDSSSFEDIQIAAKGCVKSGLKVIGIDPGPFTQCMNRELYGDTLGQKEGKKIILGIGSATPLTRKQFKTFNNLYHPFMVQTQTLKFFDADEKQAEIERVATEIIKNKDQSDVLAIVTTLEDEDVLDFGSIPGYENENSGVCAKVITEAVADIIILVLNKLKEEIGALYLTGGDMSIAVCEKSNTVGFDVKDDVGSLSIYGELLGGDYSGLPIVTKGGSVGDSHIISTCVNYLKNKIQK